MPKTTLPQLIISVRMFVFKKNHTEIRSRKFSLIFRLFGVCVCVPKVTLLIVFLQTSILRSCGGTYVATWIEMTYLS